MTHNPIKQAIALLILKRGKDAAAILKREFDANPQRYEMARIFNLLDVCGMESEALRELERLDGSIEAFQHNKPADENIGTTV